MSLVASENGPMVMPIGSRSVDRGDVPQRLVACGAPRAAGRVAPMERLPRLAHRAAPEKWNRSASASPIPSRDSRSAFSSRRSMSGRARGEPHRRAPRSTTRPSRARRCRAASGSGSSFRTRSVAIGRQRPDRAISMIV